jgi:hypothetical protein
MHNCNWCAKKYTTRGKLKIHIAKHHPLELQNFIKSGLSCYFCEYEALSPQALGSHIVYCAKNPKLVETKKKLSANCGRPHSEETRKKLSKSQSEILETRGSGGFRSIKWFKIENILGEEYVVRGTWEYRTAEWMNQNNILWKRRIYIPYVLDGKERTYTPDFFLPEHSLYLEVKGYYSEIDKKKMSAVERIIDIKMLFKKQIDSLNNIKDVDGLLKI